MQTEKERIEFEIVKTIRIGIGNNPDYAANFFIDVWQELGEPGTPNIEAKSNFNNSDARLSTLKIDDKIVAAVIETRTAFNHLEFAFCRMPLPVSISTVKTGEIGIHQRKLRRIANRLPAETCNEIHVLCDAISRCLPVTDCLRFVQSEVSELPYKIQDKPPVVGQSIMIYNSKGGWAQRYLSKTHEGLTAEYYLQRGDTHWQPLPPDPIN